MEYSELLKKVPYFEDKKLEKICNFTYQMKKKNRNKQRTGIFQNSTLKYFKFHLKGEYLCYYDYPPVPSLPCPVP